MSAGPEILSIKKESGVAGQVAYAATVQYPEEAPETVRFVGSSYGGPAVMVTPAGTQTFVTDPNRHGKFGPAWVESFFAGSE